MIAEGSEDKEKVKKKCAIKRKLKFENYKNCLEATQLDDKIYYLWKNEFNVISLKKDRKEFIKNRKLLLKTQQRFTNERHNVFTKEINKIALSLNHDKRIVNWFDRNIRIWNEQSSSKWKRRDYMWQWNKAIQITINSDDVTKENIKEHNGNWPLIPDNPYRRLIIGGSESGKTISLFNLSYESDAKDPYEAKCHFLIAKQEGTGLRHLNDSKVQGTFSESRNKKKM